MTSGRDRESRGYSVIFSANPVGGGGATATSHPSTARPPSNTPSLPRPAVLEEPDDFPVFVGGAPVSASNVRERVERDLREASSSSSSMAPGAPMPSGPRARNGRPGPLPVGRGREHALSLDPNVPTDLQSLYDLYAHDPLIKFAQDLVFVTGDRINSVIRDDSVQRLLQEPSPQIPIVSQAWHEPFPQQEEAFVGGGGAGGNSPSPPPPPPPGSPPTGSAPGSPRASESTNPRRRLIAEEEEEEGDDEDDDLLDVRQEPERSPSPVGGVVSFLQQTTGGNLRAQALVQAARERAESSSSSSSPSRPSVPPLVRPTDRRSYHWLRGDADGRGGSTVRGGIQTHRNRTGSSSSSLRGRRQGGLQIRLDLIQSEVLGAMRFIRDKIGEVLGFPPDFDLMRLVRSDLLRSRFGRMCGHQIMCNTVVNPQMHGRDTEKKKIAHEASMMQELDWIRDNVAFNRRDGTFSLKKKGRRW